MPPKYSPELIAQIVEAYNAGESLASIADRLGVDGSSINYHARKAGCTPRYKRVQRKREDENALKGGDWVLDPVRRIQVWQPS